MTERTRKTRPHESEAADVATETTEAPDKKQRDDDAIDDLLERIDDLLEANAKEFVDSYIQQGGE
jgi:ubiquitin-like protein Pup